LPLPKPCRATGHDENGRNGARITSPIGTCKTRAVEPCACPRDLFTRLAHGHLAKNIDALRSWTCVPAAKPSQQAHPGVPSERQPPFPRATTALAGFQAAEVGVSFGFPGQVAPLFWLSVMVVGDGCRRGFGMCLFV
jgi:hypothetical protein